MVARRGRRRAAAAQGGRVPEGATATPAPEQIGIGPEERLPTSLAPRGGNELADEDSALWLEELALDPWARGLEWQRRRRRRSGSRRSTVIVIGGGLGGLNAALQLKRAGIPFTVDREELRRRRHLVREPLSRRSRRHAEPLLHEHLRRRLQLPEPVLPGVREPALLPLDRRHVRAARRHRVRHRGARRSTWDEDACEWQVDVDGPDGEARAARERRHHRRRLPQPAEAARDRRDARLPRAVVPHGAVAGGPRRRGQALRRHRHRLRAATRLIPELALEAEHVVVFQRTPQWLMPTPGLPLAVPAAGELARPQPALLHATSCGSRRAISSRRSSRTSREIDPDFDDPHACSAGNKMMRDASHRVPRAQARRDPELVRTMTPPHPYLVGAARDRRRRVQRPRRDPARQRHARDRRHPPDHRDRHRDRRRRAPRRRRRSSTRPASTRRSTCSR